MPATICPAIVKVATRMPSGPRSAPSMVAADRSAALPRETVARAGIGWSAKPPPVTMMVPERAGAFKEEYTKSTAELIKRNVTAQASTLAAGVEAIGPTAASVAVILRVIQNTPGQPPSQAAPALRVALTKRGNDWLVLDVAPANSR